MTIVIPGFYVNGEEVENEPCELKVSALVFGAF